MPDPVVLIDGAIPRGNGERVEILIDFASRTLGDGTCYPPGTPLGALALKVGDLRREAGFLKVSERIADRDYGEVWAEMEDEAIGVINDLLPDGFVCTLGEPDPGDVVVRETEEAA